MRFVPMIYHLQMLHFGCCCRQYLGCSPGCPFSFKRGWSVEYQCRIVRDSRLWFDEALVSCRAVNGFCRLGVSFPGTIRQRGSPIAKPHWNMRRAIHRQSCLHHLWVYNRYPVRSYHNSTAASSAQPSRNYANLNNDQFSNIPSTMATAAL